jgi:hypothetical protein
MPDRNPTPRNSRRSSHKNNNNYNYYFANVRCTCANKFKSLIITWSSYPSYPSSGRAFSKYTVFALNYKSSYFFDKDEKQRAVKSRE